MNNEKLKGLLSYLSGLQKLQETGYNCHREIGECILAIKSEFSMDLVTASDVKKPVAPIDNDLSELTAYLKHNYSSKVTKENTVKQALTLIRLLSKYTGMEKINGKR